MSHGELDTYRPILVSIATATAEERHTSHLRSYQLWQKHAATRKFTLGKRFAKVAGEFLSTEGCTVPGVRLYFDALLVKPPGAKGAGWHKDMLQSPFKSHTNAASHFVTIWIPLDDTPPDHGAIRYASGSQNHWETTEVGMDVAGSAHQRYDALIRELGLLVTAPGRKAGDASIHSGQTLHSVLPNTSDDPRAVMTLVFFVDGLRTDNMAYQKRLQEVDRRCVQSIGVFCAYQMHNLVSKHDVYRRGDLASHVRLVGKYRWDNVWALGRRADFVAGTDMTPLVLEPEPPHCASSGLVPGLDVGDNDPMNVGKQKFSDGLQVDAYGTPMPQLSLGSEQPGMHSCTIIYRQSMLAKGTYPALDSLSCSLIGAVAGG